MSENQKLTGVIIDGVVYNITEADSKPFCNRCDLADFCTEDDCFCDFCKHYLKGNEYFKKEQPQSIRGEE